MTIKTITGTSLEACFGGKLINQFVFVGCGCVAERSGLGYLGYKTFMRITAIKSCYIFCCKNVREKDKRVTHFVTEDAVEDVYVGNC